MALVPGNLGIRAKPVMARQPNRIRGGTADDDRGGLAESRQEFVPPVLIGRRQPSHDARVLGGDIRLLARIGVYVIKLHAVNLAPAVGHDRGTTPLDRIEDPLRVGNEDSVRPGNIRIAQQRHQAHAVKLDAYR